MIRFIQRLGCCNPSSDMMAEDRRAFVAVQERLDANTATHDSHSISNGAKHLKFTTQNSGGVPVSQSRPSNVPNSEPIKQDSSEDTCTSSLFSVDQQNVNGTEGVDPEFYSDQSTTQVATMFEKAHNFRIENAPITNINHQQVINHRYTKKHGNNDLDKLEKFVSFNALHDSSAQDPERCCHPGTRQNVLDQMRFWIDDPEAPERILWLHGPAGVGKSAIAQTISYSYSRDKVGASFFFFRSDPARNDGNRLFPTLAWRLASSVPKIKDLIACSLEEDPDIPRKTIELQFDQLIAFPFLTISGGESMTRPSTPVIIIDGLDECSDVKLQERILKIIGNAVANTRFTLRFVISSRPEAHIQDFFSQYPTMQIDLASVDEAYRDIETYLTSEFARIAVEQDLDPEVWPGQGAIASLVSKSSGQFIYASTVIKYVGDKYESAIVQLNVILELKPSDGKSPFAELDALYTEILQRQPDKNFLKEFFSVLVARSMLADVKDLHEDDAMLLNIDEKQLHRKLRGMRSVLRFKPFIDVHHKSFLDYLVDSSRSGKYHVSKHFANRRYMQRITDVLVQVASRAMEQRDSRESEHFQPKFAAAIRQFPLKLELQLDDLEDILRPLQMIQENLLQLPSMSIPWKPRACSECWTFYMIDNLLLHLGYFRGALQLQEPKYVDIRTLTTVEEKSTTPQLDLDVCLSSLLAVLNRAELSLSLDTIDLMRALVLFDPTETAMRVRSITDAQNLVEFLFCLNKNQCFKSWFGEAASNATRLAIAIYGRAPLLPRCLFLNSADLNRNERTYQGEAVKLWDSHSSVWRVCFEVFVWGSLFHDNVVPLLGICPTALHHGMLEISPLLKGDTLRTWRRSSDPSISKIQLILFKVAKAIQYIHSLGIVLAYRFDSDSICLDPINHVRLVCPYFQPNDLCKEQFDYDGQGKYSVSEADILSFGHLCYEVLFNRELGFMDIIRDRPREPEIPDSLWELIQWCCTEKSKRPTIDQVLQEMESWITLDQFILSS